MEDQGINITSADMESGSNLSKFVDSYASFTRIINSLQRKYIELREELSTQNEKLAEANEKLVELSDKNIKANEFLNGILDSISVGVVAVDQNGAITHFNPAASVILGIPAGEPRGRRYEEIIPEGKPAEASAAVAARNGKTVESVEKQVELADGSTGNLSVSTALLKDRNGSPTGAVEVFQDLTKLRRMEQEIARLTTLAALGEMAATIAHQVRNPLAAIGGFASLLERDLKEGDPRRSLILKIKRGVENLNETVTALLNYSRSDKLDISSIVYPEFVYTTIEEFKNANAARMGDFHMHISPTTMNADRLLTVQMDRSLMRQVLINLLMNALEVLKGSGNVWVSYSLVPRQAAIKRYSERLILDVDETVLETKVVDDGPGIEVQDIDQVFAPFYSTKQNGHGLGLAAAAKIMKAHGGDILIDTSVTSGAAFVLSLPVKIDGANMEREA